MLRSRAVLILACLLAGCFGPDASRSTDPTTRAGAVNVIRMGIDDMLAELNRDNYTGGELAGDMLANTIVRFAESARGTNVASEAQDLLEEFMALEHLVASGAKQDELQAKVQELSEIVGTIEARQ